MLVEDTDPFLQGLQDPPRLAQVHYNHRYGITNVTLVQNKWEELAMPHNTVQVPHTHPSQEI